MKFYIIFWEAVVLFSLLSFTYMSFKVLYRGFPELKEMLRNLDNEHKKNSK